MTYWLVANPKAGDGQRGQTFWLNALARAGIREPRKVGFDDQAWTEEIRPGDVVMVAGGDGSANFGAQLCLEKQATLAVLPSGTANDFARNLALPEDPEALCSLVAQGSTQKVDVAEFDGRLFLNVAHIGLGTLPVRKSEPAGKKLFGRFSYGVELLRRLNAKRGFSAEIRCDKAVIRGRWLSVAIASGAFFGGGNEIPEASADDGQLDVVAIKPRSLGQLLLTFLTIRLNRRSPDRTSTVIQMKGRECSIVTSKSKTVTADGDVVGETPLRVVSRPRCLSVIGARVVSTAPGKARL
ncbi:diacylglycerol kinase family lipid kinase [Marinobacter salinisoli]|uniref:Diacylglycerol kinase family lipid kinase n=1 Tax=Marinobacter salinisoli TaxID=2769486 RepID=A0ABX7MR04_9GAMM|nr:diacylglycerol kinase family protein [Marinobacter salinisoli]QSP94726.1 diacylglycerol kinase family lipid kinase [Marinobacter salinisoli]